MAAAPDYTRAETPQPDGTVLITLTCNDCGAEGRLVKDAEGEKRAAAIIAAHVPSGCCQERR